MHLYIKFSPIRFRRARAHVSPFLVQALSGRWNSGYNVSRQVITRISNREIAIYSSGCCARRTGKTGERRCARKERKRNERAKKIGKTGAAAAAAGRVDVTHLATSNPLWTKLRSYHRASCQDAKPGYMYTNANERGNILTNVVPLRRGRSASRNGRCER